MNPLQIIVGIVFLAIYACLILVREKSKLIFHNTRDSPYASEYPSP